MKQNKKFWICILLSAALLLIGTFFALRLGAKHMDGETIWNALFHYEDQLNHQLIRDVRLPRVICTILVGGLLGISGAMMQAVTRNPIAEPSILGISQGATLGITLLYIQASWITSTNILLASFVGAILSGALVMLFALKNPSRATMGKLLLAGTALSTFFLSLSTVIAILTNHAQMIAFLTGGGFRNVGWFHVLQLVITSIIALMISMLLATKINALSLGDDICISLGEHPTRIRFYTLLLIIFISAICVAVAKNISFVGLIIPQMISRLIKKDMRFVLPASFLAGGVLLVFADILARMLLSPYETPIGIFTSLMGIPFFLYLVRRERSE